MRVGAHIDSLGGGSKQNEAQKQPGTVRSSELG